MASANIIFEQMQLWQECNDTSTQLVNKTMGEICLEDVFKERNSLVVQTFVFYVIFCWIWQIFIFSGYSLPSSRGY